MPQVSPEVRLVVDLALGQAATLPVETRIQLYAGVGQIMSETELGEAASEAAFFMARAEAAQLRLFSHQSTQGPLS
jgi:hypothetical protein